MVDGGIRCCLVFLVAQLGWVVLGLGGQIVTTSAASSMANADSSALLEDEDDEPQSSAHSSRPVGLQRLSLLFVVQVVSANQAPVEI